MEKTKEKSADLCNNVTAKDCSESVRRSGRVRKQIKPVKKCDKNESAEAVPKKNEDQPPQPVISTVGVEKLTSLVLSKFRIPKKKNKTNQKRTEVLDVQESVVEIESNKKKNYKETTHPKSSCSTINNKVNDNTSLQSQTTKISLPSKVPLTTQSSGTSNSSILKSNKSDKLPRPKLNVRRTSSNSNRKVLQREPNLKDHTINNIPEISTSTTISSSSKSFPDLPDYEETEEVMEWENMFPEILKLVQEKSSSIQNTNPVPEFTDDDEVDKMDVDSDGTEQLVIVPDTNIWIGSMDLLKILMEKSFPRVSYPTIVLPWMVLQELDVQVHKKTSQLESARGPINFIYSLLKSKNPRLKGQKASDAAVSKFKFDEIVADDSILNCVFQNQKGNNIVLFLTNDKNLLNKALVHGVHACDSRSALEKINEILEENTIESLESSPSTSISNYKLKASTKRKLQNDLSGSRLSRTEIKGYDCTDFMDIEMRDDSMTNVVETEEPIAKIRLIEQPLSNNNTYEKEIFQALLSAFSYIIRRKMVEDYGMEGWEYALKVKPPWTLKTSIKCMINHWIANFSYVFMSHGKSCLEKLLELLTTYERPFSSPTDKSEHFDSIIESGLALFNGIDKTVLNESPVVASCQRMLMEYAIANQTK